MKIYVSLTSIYDNQEALLKTLQSIDNQKTKPTKCYIYLSEKPYLLDRGFGEKKIQSNVQEFIESHALFEIRWCDNLGPYRKLLPLLQDMWDDDCLILTIDDDTIYHPDLITNYVRDYQKYQCCIAYRGFTMSLKHGLSRITYTEREKLNHKYLYNFHTGKGGVVYHPSFFHRIGKVIFDRVIYRECAETGDDIWFNFMRIANGVECYVKEFNYMVEDCTTKQSLYVNFNMKHNLNTINIQKTVGLLVSRGFLKDPHPTFDSDQYWDNRYKNRGSSGDGSYGEKAFFKGKFLTDFIRQYQIGSVIDYGVGDGNQLRYINTTHSSYLGLDVSPTAIKLCREIFKSDGTKKFCEVKDYDWSETVDLAISSDVIYHLIDDQVYFQYMKNLFTMSQKFVIIHAVDHDYVEATHVKFRHFTPYVEKHFPQWKMIQFTHNHLWHGKAGSMGFYVFQKLGT